MNRVKDAILRGLGRAPDRDRFSLSCLQCGRPDTTVVYRLGRRSARYWCTACDAVAVVPDLSLLRTEVPPRPKPVAPRAPRVLAPAVARWAERTSRKPVELPDKAAYTQVHARFDRAVAGAVSSGRVPDSLSDVDLSAHLSLPSVSAILGSLHDNCYNVDIVVGLLSEEDSERAGAIRDRVDHARRWLSTSGRALCWIVAKHVPEARPPAEDVVRAAKRWAADEDITREEANALRLALFAVDGGPRPHKLLECFTADEVVSAATAYANSGTPTLRARVLASLDAD